VEPSEKSRVSAGWSGWTGWSGWFRKSYVREENAHIALRKKGRVFSSRATRSPGPPGPPGPGRTFLGFLVGVHPDQTPFHPDHHPDQHSKRPVESLTSTDLPPRRATSGRDGPQEIRHLTSPSPKVYRISALAAQALPPGAGVPGTEAISGAGELWRQTVGYAEGADAPMPWWLCDRWNLCSHQLFLGHGLSPLARLGARLPRLSRNRLSIAHRKLRLPLNLLLLLRRRRATPPAANPGANIVPLQATNASAVEMIHFIHFSPRAALFACSSSYSRKPPFLKAATSRLGNAGCRPAKQLGDGPDLPVPPCRQDGGCLARPRKSPRAANVAPPYAPSVLEV
jgi:hypothetical protein